MVNKKTFKVIKFAGAGALSFILDQEIEYQNKKSKEITTNLVIYPGDEIEIDIDAIKRTTSYVTILRDSQIIWKKISGGNNNTKIKINDKDYTIVEYNEAFYHGKHPILIEVKDLYAEIYGSSGKGDYQELVRSKKIDRGLFATIDRDTREIIDKELSHLLEITNNDDASTIESKRKKSDEIMKKVRQLVNGMRIMKANRDAISQEDINEREKPENYEKTKKQAASLQAKKEAAYKEIESALNQDPKVSTDDLEPKHQNWELVMNCQTESLLEDMKTRILSDIRIKRAAKQGNKRKRDDNDNKENKKPKLDTNKLTQLINEAKTKNTYEELALILLQIEAYEGEKAYHDNKDTIKTLKSKMIDLNNGDYKIQVVQRIKGRIDKLTDKIGTQSQTLLNKLEQLKNTSDANEITRLEEEINREVGQSEANILLDKLINELQAIVKRGKNGNDVQELNNKLAEIKDFAKSTNTYQQTSYSRNKEKVEKVLSEAESLNKQQTPDKGIEPWKIIVPVSLIGGLLITALIVIRSRRKNKIA